MFGKKPEDVIWPGIEATPTNQFKLQNSLKFDWRRCCFHLPLTHASRYVSEISWHGAVFFLIYLPPLCAVPLGRHQLQVADV